MKLYLRPLTAIKYYPKGNLPVSAQDATISRGSLPRGIYGPILRYTNFMRLRSRESLVSSGKYFQVRFFPTTHYLSLFRKSKPSVTIKFNNNQTFLNHCGQYLQKLYSNSRSVVPSDYAVWRRKMTLEIKKTFIDEWYKLYDEGSPVSTSSKQTALINKNSGFEELDKINISPNTSKDGYYVFHINEFPTKEAKEMFQSDIRKAVRIVANLKSTTYGATDKRNNKKSNDNWVEDMNNKLNIHSVNKLLRDSDCPYELVKDKQKV